MWRPKLLGEDILQLLVDFPGGFGLAVDSVDVYFCSFKNSFPQWFLKRKVDADSPSVLVCCWFLHTSPPVDSFRVPQILTDRWPVEVILDHWARDMALKMSMFHTFFFQTKWTPLVILVLVRLFRLHDVSFPTFWLFRYVEKKIEIQAAADGPLSLIPSCGSQAKLFGRSRWPHGEVHQVPELDEKTWKNMSKKHVSTCFFDVFFPVKTEKHLKSIWQPKVSVPLAQPGGRLGWEEYRCYGTIWNHGL